MKESPVLPDLPLRNQFEEELAPERFKGCFAFAGSLCQASIAATRTASKLQGEFNSVGLIAGVSLGDVNLAHFAGLSASTRLRQQLGLTVNYLVPFKSQARGYTGSTCRQY